MKPYHLKSLNSVFLRLFWAQFLIPMLLLIFLSVGITGYWGGQAVQDQQARLNTAMAYTVTNYMDSTKHVLESLAAYGEKSNLEDFSLALDMQQKGYQNFDAIYLLDNTGKVIATVPRDDRYLDLDLSNQLYFKNTIHTAGVFTSPPFMSLRTGYPAVFLATQVKGLGVLVGELSLTELQTIISTGRDLPWKSTIFVTDQYGTLLAHPDFQRVAQQDNASNLGIIHKGLTGATTQFYLEGGNLYVGRASLIEPDGWLIVTQTLASEIYAPYYGTAFLLIFLFLILLLLFIRRLFHQFNHLIIHPITQLSRFSGSIASGDYFENKRDINTVPVTFHELATLISNFNLMSQSVESRERQLAFMATHDFLTDLPNRPLFQKKLVETIQEAKRTKSIFALLFIDLDNFKTINDAFGHQKGDQTLRMVAKLLTDIAPKNAFLGRLGGDEFGVILPGMSLARDAIALADQILELFNTPLQLEGNQVYMSISMGISFYPDDGTEPDTLIQNADTAMYSAKHEGKNGYQFYNLEMKTQAQERHVLSTHLHHALQLNELSLVYHPIFTTTDQKLAGCEALLRWKTPRLGQVPPDRFIPLANETGLILPIGEWILRTACTQARCWLDMGYAIPVNVNIAERQLKHKNFAEMVTRILDETRLPPNLLKLELTENIFFQNYKDKELDIVLSQVKRLGVMFALDDFGTGYSALSCLTQIPFDEIKIDRSLSSNVIAQQREASIVRGILNMAKDLGMKVVAEGIENKEQIAFYRNLNCDLLQGYYFCRPLSTEDMNTFLSEKHSLE